MVFNVVACFIQGKEEPELERYVTSAVGSGSKALAEVFNVNLDKARFKVGTLDSLMELNETLQKVDQTLDSTVKKIEKQAREMVSRDLKIEVTKQQQVDVADYIKNFNWDDNKFHRGRSLVEIAGLISDRMRQIDNDIKTLNDNLNEVKNELTQMVKKDGTTLLNKDISDVIHSDPNIKADELFVEVHKTTFLSTVVVVLHKTKYDQFKEVYERLIRDSEIPCVVPGSLKYLGIEDKEGNQLHRVVVVSNKIDDYLQRGRQEGFTFRKFVYDYKKYQEDLQQKTRLETSYEQQKNSLASRCYFAFSELFICLMHLKVMRAFIDGVLRFGIPPRFYIGIIKPGKGVEKQVLQRLCETFADNAMREMYGTKEETNDTEDFFPFVNIPLTSPLFLQ